MPPNTEPATPEATPLRCGRSQRFELQPAERRLLVDGPRASLGARTLDLRVALAGPGNSATSTPWMRPSPASSTP